MLRSSYKIPLKLNAFLGSSVGSSSLPQVKEKLPRHTESIKRAISEHIDVLLLTRFGEYRPDFYYGLELWNHEFESKDLDMSSKEKLIKSVISTLEQYEPRIVNINIDEFYFSHKELKIKEKILLLYVLNIAISAQVKQESLTQINRFNHRMEIPVKVYYRQKN